MTSTFPARPIPGMTQGMSDLSEQKAALRAAALERRNALSSDERARAARAIAMRRFPIPLGEGTSVAGYSPIRSECDPVPLMRSLASTGAVLALPVVEGADKPLSFGEWRPGMRLVTGPHGIPQPSEQAVPVEPDILLVPLAAFDRAGRRIGYGGGYYDRTLASLRKTRPVIAVGVAFAVQEVDAIPAEDHDETLDLVLTEREIVDPFARKA